MIHIVAFISFYSFISYYFDFCKRQSEKLVDIFYHTISKFLKQMNCVLQMFVIFIVCRIAVHQMMNVAATTAWTKDGIVGAT